MKGSSSLPDLLFLETASSVILFYFLFSKVLDFVSIMHAKTLITAPPLTCKHERINEKEQLRFVYTTNRLLSFIC